MKRYINIRPEGDVYLVDGTQKSTRGEVVDFSCEYNCYFGTGVEDLAGIINFWTGGEISPVNYF